MISNDTAYTDFKSNLHAKLTSVSDEIKISISQMNSGISNLSWKVMTIVCILEWINIYQVLVLIHESYLYCLPSMK